MKLLNFSIVGEHGIGIEVEALGTIWNLHDSSFRCLHHDILGAKVRLEWKNDSPATHEYPAVRFGIVFHGAHQFEVSARDHEMPLDEDRCLEFVSGVDAPACLAETVYHGYSTVAPLGPDYLLFFTFRGGQRILVGADGAEFVLLDAT